MHSKDSNTYKTAWAFTSPMSSKNGTPSQDMTKDSGDATCRVKMDALLLARGFKSSCITEMREGVLFVSIDSGSQHKSSSGGSLSLSMLILPFVETRTRVTLWTPSHRNSKGRVISRVRSLAVLRIICLTVPSSPLMELNGEHPWVVVAWQKNERGRQ